MTSIKVTYQQVGDDYSTKDPIKKLAQTFAAQTAKNLGDFTEVENIRGESAYVWKQGDIFMASVIEGLGTKNLVADEMRRITNTIGSTRFLCPRCSKTEIVRCFHCREIAAKYKCPSCGFEGPD